MKLLKVMTDMGLEPRDDLAGSWSKKQDTDIPYDIVHSADLLMGGSGQSTRHSVRFNVWVISEVPWTDASKTPGPTSSMEEMDQVKEAVQKQWPSFKGYFNDKYFGGADYMNFGVSGTPIVIQDPDSLTKEEIRAIEEAYGNTVFGSIFVNAFIGQYFKDRASGSPPEPVAPPEATPEPVMTTKPSEPSLHDLGGCPDCGAKKNGPIIEHAIQCPRMRGTGRYSRLKEAPMSMLKAKRIIRARRLRKVFADYSLDMGHGTTGSFWWHNGNVWVFDDNHLPAAKRIWPKEMEWWDTSCSYEDYRVPFRLGAIRGWCTYDMLAIHGPGSLRGNTQLIKRVVNDVYNATGKCTELNAIVAVDTYPDNSQVTEYTLSDFVTPLPEHLTNQVEEFWETGPADIWLDNIRSERIRARLRRRRIVRARRLRKVFADYPLDMLNWRIEAADNGYSAPETRQIVVTGTCPDHPTAGGRGAREIQSPIIRVSASPEGWIAMSNSRSYLLGREEVNRQFAQYVIGTEYGNLDTYMAELF